MEKAVLIVLENLGVDTLKRVFYRLDQIFVVESVVRQFVAEAVEEVLEKKQMLVARSVESAQGKVLSYHRSTILRHGSDMHVVEAVADSPHHFHQAEPLLRIVRLVERLHHVFETVVSSSDKGSSDDRAVRAHQSPRRPTRNTAFGGRPVSMSIAAGRGSSVPAAPEP